MAYYMTLSLSIICLRVRSISCAYAYS